MPSPDPSVLGPIVASLHFDDPDAAVQRAALDAAGEATPLPDGVTVEPTTLADLPAERVLPSGSSPACTVLLLHGGGYCIGSLVAERYFAARLALAADGDVWTVEYRLAPEHPFPAAYDDAVDAWSALVATSTPGPAATAIVGESAGGGLAIAAAVAARDSGVGMPAAVACVSPWADLTLSGRSFVANDGRDLVVSQSATRRWRDWYLAGTPADDPRASPLFGDLRRLPPLLVQVGGDELLRDDGTRLADRAEQAGVDVTLRVWEGNSHVAAVYPPEVVPDSTAAVHQIARFLDAHLDL